MRTVILLLMVFACSRGYCIDGAHINMQAAKQYKSYKKYVQDEPRGKNKNSEKIMAAALCNCTSVHFFNGLPITFSVSYESNYGCDPCFATHNYGRISFAGYTIDEGEFSMFGLGMACNTNMQHCPA